MKIINTALTDVTSIEKQSVEELEKIGSVTDTNPSSLGLSLRQRLILRLFGCVFLRYEKREGWRGSLPIYLVYCKLHNLYYLDYPHSWDSHFYPCPQCRKKEARNE